MDHIENAKIKKSSQQRGWPLPFQQRGKGGLLMPHLIGCEKFPIHILVRHQIQVNTIGGHEVGESEPAPNSAPCRMHGYETLFHSIPVTL